MWPGILKNRNGQQLIEYAIIVVVVIGAMVAMSTYVLRSIQATEQMIQKGFMESN